MGFRFWLVEKDRELILHAFDFPPLHHFQLHRFLVLIQLFLDFRHQILTDFLRKFVQPQHLQSFGINYRDLWILIGIWRLLRGVPGCFTTRDGGETLDPVGAVALSRRLRILTR